MTRKEHRSRTQAFAWHTRQELYDFFRDRHQLDKKDVDREIEQVRRHFKLRKHRPINPQELWEKVGRNLEKNIGSRAARPAVDDLRDEEVDV